MAQYKTGLVNVENGAYLVEGLGTAWFGNVGPNWNITIGDDQVTYRVEQVINNTDIILSVPYGGSTAKGLNYAITADYTDTKYYPKINRGEAKTRATIYRLAQMLDSDSWPFPAPEDLPVVDNDADLLDITLSVGALEPVFDPNILSYEVFLPFDDSETTVTVTPSNPAASVLINGTLTLSKSINVDPGNNIVTVTVTSTDMSTFQTYIINVIRENPYVITLLVDTLNNTPNDVGFYLSRVLSLPTEVVIDWGDNNIDSVTITNDSNVLFTHTYTTPGIYTVNIAGDIRSFRTWLNSQPPPTYLETIVAVVSFGTNIRMKSFSMNGCKNLISVPTSLPPSIRFLNNAFNRCENFNQDISGWDTSNVNDMISMFSEATSFNQPISDWDTSNVISMTAMFYKATSFNQDISGWDVSSIVSINAMFFEATSFNQDLSNWCLFNDPDPGNYDAGATSWVLPRPSFGDRSCIVPLILKVDTSLDTNQSITVERIITGYSGRFYVEWGDGNITDVKGFDTVTHTYTTPGNYTIRVYHKSGFIGAQQWPDEIGTPHGLNITSNILYECEDWGVTGSSAIEFGNCINLVAVPNQLDPVFIQTRGMFAGATAFNQDISGWDVSSIVSMDSMFSNATSFNQPLNAWDVSNVLTMSQMFSGATAFNQDISGWDMSNPKNLFGMFIGATSFNQDISGWDVSNNNTTTKNMSRMFEWASAFNQDLSSWCVENIPTQPFNFDTGATSWTLPKPNWGDPC